MNEQKITKREMRRIKRQEKQKRRELAIKKRQQRRVVTLGVGFVVIILIIVGLSNVGSNEPALESETNPQLVTSQDHIKGNPDAYVTLVEYSDFQCPACRTYYPLLKQLNEKHPDDVRIVYRHFPLVQIHPYAVPAAQASEAAGIQGKFWEMHDKLFETQDGWSKGGVPDGFFSDLAGTIGLDVEKFKKDMDSSEVKSKIERDKQFGDKLNVTGTPTFYLNGKKLSNPKSFEELDSLIDDAIANIPTINPITGELDTGESGIETDNEIDGDFATTTSEN